MLDLIKARISRLEEVCPTIEVGNASYPTKGGNDCLYLGLLASVGYQPAMDGVFDCQTKVGEHEGLFQSNPKLAADERQNPPIFSSDMALGVLCWLMSSEYSSRSILAAELWLKWINKNRRCLIPNPKIFGGGCLLRGGYRYAPNKESNITPSMWSLMGRVWDHRGLEPHKMMELAEGSFSIAEDEVSVLEAEFCALGYQLHLKAVQAYIKLQIQQSTEYRKKVTKMCYARLPENLFYKILHQEGASKEDMEVFLAMLPNPMTFRPQNYWLWEREDYTEAVRQGKICGWNMVFLGKLILQFA